MNCSPAPGGSYSAVRLELTGTLERAALSSSALELSPGSWVHVALHLSLVLLGHKSPEHSDGGE